MQVICNKAESCKDKCNHGIKHKYSEDDTGGYCSLAQCRTECIPVNPKKEKVLIGGSTVMAILDSVKPSKVKKWVPKVGDHYYYIDSCMDISEFIWANDEIDKKHYESGNCFPTRKQAVSMMGKVKKLLREGL